MSMSMKSGRWAALLLALFLLLAATNARATGGNAIMLRNVTIVDVERNRLVPRRDVVIVGDRIVGIQADGTARTPRQGRVLDGTGRYLMPGLWDFHVHVFSAPGEEDFALPLYILNGISSAPRLLASFLPSYREATALARVSGRCGQS